MGLQMRKIPYGYTFYPVLWKGEAYAVDLLWSRDGIVSGYVINLWRKIHRLACGMKAPFPTFFLH